MAVRDPAYPQSRIYSHSTPVPPKHYHSQCRRPDLKSSILLCHPHVAQSRTTHTPLPAFLPRSRAQLKSAVDACTKLFPKVDCSNGPHGPIGECDVSRVTDMSRMFSSAKWFRSDISKWDVSNVRDMSGLFQCARSFNIDISKWYVSSVGNMDSMFLGAMSFTRKLCGFAWVHSNTRKDVMFTGSPGSTSRTVCAKINKQTQYCKPSRRSQTAPRGCGCKTYMCCAVRFEHYALLIS